MNGMNLAREFYYKYEKNFIRGNLKKYEKYLAAGLVGEGSECYGFDDEYSQDHDFGARFFIWIPREIYREIGEELQKEYLDLPDMYRGYVYNATDNAGMRRGIISIEDFYLKYLGYEYGPTTNLEWLRIPETFLSVATNGEVFKDNLGKFTQIRDVLKAFYPNDVLRKKIAAKAAIASQAGQYNYGRCGGRYDFNASYLSCSEFINNVLSIIYLLNREYTPFYKWIFRKSDSLKILTPTVENIKTLSSIPDNFANLKRKKLIIEEICVDISKELKSQGFSNSDSPFLLDHCNSIMAGIIDEKLATMHVMIDKI